MTSINKHGLSRTIPEAIKLAVRQDAYFGCIFCGCGIYEYEHIIPEWTDAKEHHPNHMTLLCPTCHSKVTKGLTSKDKVFEAKKNPYGKIHGPQITLDIESPGVTLGTNKLIGPNGLIFSRVHHNILSLSHPSPQDGEMGYKLNAKIFNSKGQLALEIIDNEWLPKIGNWDFRIKGNEICISEQYKKITLKAKIIPSEGINISHMDMLVGITRFKVHKGKIIIMPNIFRPSAPITFENMTFQGYGQIFGI